MVSSERAHGFWRNLSHAERRELTTGGRPFSSPAGSVLIDQWDRSGAVIVLQSGFAKVVARVTPVRQVVLAIRGPGDILGEMAGIDGGRRSAAVIAVGDVTGLTISGVPFQDLIARSAHAAGLLTRTLVDRLREADRDRLAVAAMTVRQRLARLLLTLAARYGTQTTDGITIGLLSQKDLAACIGGAHRSVAREVRLWRDERIISTGRRSVTVHRPGELHRIAAAERRSSDQT